MVSNLIVWCMRAIIVLLVVIAASTFIPTKKIVIEKIYWRIIKMKGFHIRVMFGNQLQTFSFATDEDEIAEEKFDEAVKEINRIYHETGRFATKEEVVKHFHKYGFYRFQT